MFWQNLTRALTTERNPVGFGAADALELALAALLITAALFGRAWLEPRFRQFAARTSWCMVLLAILPVALRLLLLSHHPIPEPDGYAESSPLLAADTLRHFRLANPPHALPQFFETFSVLQEPTYSAVDPVGEGLALILGWSGVLLWAGAFYSLCYWMLRGWTTPAWALLGGILAAIEFGPLNQWTNSYQSGALTAAAGCLVFGSLPRLRAGFRTRDAALLGAGVGLHLLLRPYETILLLAAVLLFFRPGKNIVKLAGVTALAVLPAVLLILLQNKQVTGSWTTTPTSLSQFQYGVPAPLTFEPRPEPHRPLTPQQGLDYKMQQSFRPSTETFATYFQRLEYRVRFYRFFFLAPLYLAVLAFFASLREYRIWWTVITLAIFALATNFIPIFQTQSLAAVTGLFVLVAVTGLRQISRLRIRGQAVGREAAALIVILCCAHFLFWYGIYAAENETPARHAFVAHELDRIPGQLLVFVRYQPQHPFQDEWVSNRAEIDASRIVWARDLGAAENEKLLRYYPRRVALLLEPDNREPRLSEYKR